MFNSVSDAIYVLDQSGKFIDVNEGAVQMYGYPHSVLVGKDPSFVSVPGKNDMQSVQNMMVKAFNGEPQQFEFWGLRAGGEQFLKDVRLYHSVYFGQNVIVAVARDITDRKQQEVLLKNKVDELERLNQKLLGDDEQVSALKSEVNALLERQGEKRKYT